MGRRFNVEQKQNNLRGILIGIILLTLPFYCVGLVLWGTAAPRTQIQPTNTPGGATTVPDTLVPTVTPTVLGGPSITPLPLTVEIPGSTFEPVPIQPTPFPTAIQPTRFLSPTPTTVIIPTATTPPPVVPTDLPPPTVAPAITDTPIPFES